MIGRPYEEGVVLEVADVIESKFGYRAPQHTVGCNIFPRFRSRQERLVNALWRKFGAAAIVLLLIPLIPSGKSQAKPPQARKAPAYNALEAIRLNNLGGAYMGQQRFAQALKLFEQAYALDPQLQAAQLNQAIALLNLQRFEPARVLLVDIVKRRPEDARAWHNLGLLYKAQGQAAEALDAFQRAAQFAPQDADAAYFVGSMASQLKREQDSIPAFQRALQLNPFHVSAEFGLARAYQHLGQQEEAGKHLARYQQLSQTKLGSPMSLAYGDQGALSIAAQARSAEEPVAPAVPVKFVSVGQQAGITRAPSAGPPSKNVSGTGACFFDFDNDGRPDIYVGGFLYRNLGNGKFADVTRRAGLPDSGAAVCAAGDYDNDGFTDLALAIGEQIILFHNEHDGTFKPVSAAAGIKNAGHAISGLAWIDYDHDGDLDLYVTTDTAARGGANVMWRNNNNGTFSDVTAELSLASKGPSTAAIATDYNNDRAVDLVVTGASTQLFVNPREGQWMSSQPWASAMPEATVGVAALDFNKDGWMDLAFTHSTSPGLTLWRNVDGKRFERVPLPDLHWSRGWGVIALDYDNDGWIDFAALGETADGRGELRLLRNEGPRGFRDVTHETGLDKVHLKNPRALAAADFDGDGDLDLLVTQDLGPTLLLRNDGANQNHSLRIALKGLIDNKSAIGTKVEVFAGDLWQKWEISGAGFLSQSATPLLVGLGKRQQVDVVRILWPSGVVQDEADLAPRKDMAILEIDRRGSSCPVLFAWDGSRYRFVSDMIGAGVIGHWIAPGVRNVADSTEYLKIEDFQPQLRHGRFSFRFLEPMEEVVYLDQVRLLALDHPSDTEVYPNEYFSSNPPFPEFKVIASRAARPVRAWDDTGREVTATLRDRDHQYVADLALLPFKGFTRPHSLVLDLGEPYATGPLRLLLSGYIEYFTASSMYAAHQAGLEPVAPYVEAMETSGKWVRVLDDMGFPAGLPRTITVDLSGKVPAGTRRLRITTNLQIYWDQIVVDRTGDSILTRMTDVPLARAALQFHGYPRAIEGHTPGDLTYVYEDVSRTGPYARARGAYTRLGDVRELLTRVDDRFVVFGSGEEIALEFDPAGLPPLPPGWKRDYFFFAEGYEKDMDFYAAEALTVEPLPFHDMGVYPYSAPATYPDDAAHQQYRLDFNTRFVSRDAAPGAFRFVYRSSQPRRRNGQAR